MEQDPIREVKLVPVIMTVAERGEGTQNDPAREVTQFWSRKGELLAENDPHIDRG